MTGPAEVLLDLLFPPKCVFCRKLLHKGEEGLCAACRSSLPWTLSGEAGQRLEFVSLCVSPLWYQDAVRASFHRYKFKGMTAYARLFGSLVAQCARENLAGEYDLISWVPLSSERLHERGYDQAMLIALAAALELDDVAVETLRKIRNAAPQSGTESAEERRANISGAYEIIDPELVREKRILLIDDIITTGSTVSECARTLGLAGAESVVCVCLAR